MKRTFTFLNRNIKEMARDPLVYLFCLGFPLVMLILFSVINQYTQGNTPMFELSSLIPGIMMFSFTFVMLHMALLVSKDKTTALLKRLYTSPMKSHEFVFGYAIIGMILGIIQAIATLLFGYILSLVQGVEYIGFAECLFVVLTQMPILVFFVFAGILFGTLLNDKSAPGICSILISAAGVLGGCWMPLETMGGFRDLCCYIPFYPSVCLGRIAADAIYITGERYTWSSVSTVGMVLYILYVITIPVLSVIIFKKRSVE